MSIANNNYSATDKCISSSNSSNSDISNITANYWHQAKTTLTNRFSNQNSHIASNNNLDNSYNIVNLEYGIADLLFWGFAAFNQRDQHQSLKRCNPRFLGRGDDSVYNRSCIGLKAIVTVVGGFANSLITRVSFNNSISHTYLGYQNNWSLAILHCSRPFCFNFRRKS